jgi:hypothetical protein
MARASRWARNLPKPRAASALSVALAPLGLSRLDGYSPNLQSRRRRASSKPCPQPCRDAPTNDVGLDQNGRDEQNTDERRHHTSRQREDSLHLDGFAVDDFDAGNRQAFAQHLIDENRQECADETANDAATPAKDRRAADNHRGDDDQFGVESRLWGDALVLRRRHERRNGGAKRG